MSIPMWCHKMHVAVLTSLSEMFSNRGPAADGGTRCMWSEWTTSRNVCICVQQHMLIRVSKLYCLSGCLGESTHQEKCLGVDNSEESVLGRLPMSDYRSLSADYCAEKFSASALACLAAFGVANSFQKRLNMVAEIDKM